MNQQNMSKITSSSTSDHPVKRKRGRPRKDEHTSRNEKRQIPTTPSSLLMSQPPPIPSMTNIQQPLTITTNPNISDNHNMVGQVATGVIDGVFDAGYLLSVRVGPSNTLLRGLVFQQGHFCPITQSNDIAPHLKMPRRENLQIPITNQTALYASQGVCAKQTPQISIPVTMHNYQATPIMAGESSNSALPDNLRMVEQDELMQVFEISKIVEEQPKNNECDHGLKNDHELVSDSDLMAESLPRNDVVKHPSPHCSTPLVQDIDHQPLINEVDKKKQQEGKNLETITHIKTGMEEPQSVEKEIVRQESERRHGEVNEIDVNQDPNQGVAIDDYQAY